MTLTFDLPMTLTLDFQGQIFQLLYFRKGLSAGHEIKGIWIDKIHIVWGVPDYCAVSLIYII